MRFSNNFQSAITIARCAPIKIERGGGGEGEKKKKIRHLINTRDTRKFYSVEGRSAKTKRGGVELINYSLITLHRDARERESARGEGGQRTRLQSSHF